MSWKKNKDSGLDYDTRIETAYQKAKRKLFNDDNCASGCTTIFNENIEHVEEPKLSLKERIKSNVTQGKKIRKRIYDGI